MAVILALEEVLGPEGTLVMPAHSSDLSDPALWENPPVPRGWWETIRRTMPAFDRDLTPTRAMGVIAETFRKQRGVVRSYSPRDSFAARGKHAGFVTGGHSPAYSLGEESPLARVCELGGSVLLLGVDHANNTSLHLAEYRASFPGKHEIKQGSPVMVDGRRQWLEFPDIDTNDDDFPAIGEAFAATGLQRRGKVGAAESLLMPQRDLVDFAVGWMEQNRKATA